MRVPLCLIPSAAALLAALPAIGQETTEPDQKVEATVVVIGDRENLLSISGSGATLEAEDLSAARVLTINEALRQVAGVYPRDEEGIGLRPNIGVRGLSPTRSTEVLLLEDGLPLTYAPYGDNASYSHPPLRRFERIEVLKGASQIRFGPHTVGGVVNYISPSSPEAFERNLQLAGGNRGYIEATGSLGGSAGGFRLLGHAAHTAFEGVRDNTSLNFNDYHLRIERSLSSNQELTARVGYFAEDSQVTY
ncbi:MAG: TonB-dependent receptor plug domain-containing protein [Hyphomonas sp.]